MVVNCEHVWKEISNYLEGDVSPELRAAMEAHFRECRHCTAVLDGTRNIVHLYADDRLIELPAGFSKRWQSKLAESMSRPSGTAYGWLVAVAALALISGSFALARLVPGSPFTMRSYHAEPGTGVPAGMMVEVTEDGKTFHVPESVSESVVSLRSSVFRSSVVSLWSLVYAFEWTASYARSV